MQYVVSEEGHVAQSISKSIVERNMGTCLKFTYMADQNESLIST